MVAHNGMCHDHVMLVKTMIMWGVTPPKWRFADSLPIFKLVVDPNKPATLSVLANRYAPWFNHVQHDGLSDAMALRHVVTCAVTGWHLACYVFSSSCDDFVKSVGLNASMVRSMNPFPDM